MADAEAKETSPLLPDRAVVHAVHVGQARQGGAGNIVSAEPPGAPTALIGSQKQQHQHYTIPAPVSSAGPMVVAADEGSPLYQSYEYQPDCGSVNSNSNHDLMASDRSMMETTTGNMGTLMHLIKGNLGTGLLALPKAFSYAGIWFGVGGMLVMGAVAVHCMHCLIKCSQILCKRSGHMSLDYADVLEVALKTGPKRLHRYSRVGKKIVNGFLIFTQLGFCCVYVVFIATNVKEVIHHFHKDDPSLLLYEVIVMGVLIPLVCVRNLSFLAPFSAFANVLTATGLVIIFQYLLQGLPPTTSRPSFSSVTDLPMFFGTAIFAVEGICLVLPLENNMKRPEEFGGWTGVLNLGMAIVVAMYTAVGFYGYLKFGDDALGSITLNLPKDKWLYLSVKLMFSVAIYISYSIQLYVAVKIIWPKMRKYFKSKSTHKNGEYFFRIGLVILTFCIAAVVPHLDLLISLIGASASTALALLLPAFIEMVTLAGEPPEEEYSSTTPGVIVVNMEGRGFLRVSKLVTVKNIVIFLFGLLGWLTGTYASLRAIIEAF